MITRAEAARPPARPEAKAGEDARRAPGPKSRWASPWLWGFLSTGALALLILQTQAGSEVSAGRLIGRGGRLDDQIRVAVAPGAGEARGEGEAGGFSLGAFAAQMKGVGLYLFKWLAAAFFLEALIVHYVDPAWIGALLGSENPWSIPLASAVGVPLYTSGVAAIPITKGLLAAGMGPGAAMAFLVAGPGTCAPAMAGVWALVRSKVFAIYLGAALLGSLVAGYAFQLVTRP